MKLFEYEAKALAKKFGIMVPKGFIISRVDEARDCFERLGGPVVLKAQVLVAGRGKAGGIKFGESREEAKSAASTLLSSNIKGEKVEKILVEEKVQALKELYVGIVVNRTDKCYTILLSSEGGVDIEQMAEEHPEKLHKFNVDPLKPFLNYHGRRLAKLLGYEKKKLLSLADVILKLYEMAETYDAELIESNPLIEDDHGSFIAADLRVILDDNAIYRQTELVSSRDATEPELTTFESRAKKEGLSYVDLDGGIGVLGNGAGLVMATLDLVKYYGGSPANFCDVGGGASSNRVAVAAEILLSNEKVKVLLVNILGGITRCDEVAKGILDAQKRVQIRKPIVIRLVGTNEAEGRRILEEGGIPMVSTMEDAARRAVQIGRGP